MWICVRSIYTKLMCKKPLYSKLLLQSEFNVMIIAYYMYVQDDDSTMLPAIGRGLRGGEGLATANCMAQYFFIHLYNIVIGLGGMMSPNLFHGNYISG